MYGIFTYIWLIVMVNVGIYTSPMDGMGYSRNLLNAESLPFKNPPQNSVRFVLSMTPDKLSEVG